MEPAQTIIKAFGGEKEVSRILKTSATAPYRWQHSPDKGGTAGRIPEKQAIKLIAYARENNVAISPEEIMAAALRPEMARLLKSDGAAA